MEDTRDSTGDMRNSTGDIRNIAGDMDTSLDRIGDIAMIGGITIFHSSYVSYVSYVTTLSF